MASIKLNWGEIYYEYFKRNTEVTIVFIHGLVPGSEIWYKQIEEFTDYSVLIIDLPGRGLSQEVKDYSIGTSVKIIQSIINKEQIKNFVMVGISMGGYIVQHFAKEIGGALGYVISGTTPIESSFYFPLELLSFKHSAVYLRSMVNSPLIEKTIAEVSATEEGTEFITRVINDIDLDEFFKLWMEMTDFFVYESFQFNAPLLVLVGGLDKMGSIVLHRDDWKRYKDTTILEIPNAGHLLNIDNAREFNKRLREFVNKIELDLVIKKSMV